MNDQTIKLQSFMSHAGIASRRASEKLIEDKKVLVNNQTAHIGQRIDPTRDTVVVSGKAIEKPEKFRYFLVNKPVGYVSTTSDELKRRTVLKLLPQNIKERLYPVGRLDIESEGLLLLTNDGTLAQKLTHPSHKVRKTYHVIVRGTPTFKALNHLRNGVKLKDGFTKKAEVEVLLKDDGQTTLEITIKEGRNRQIR
ncbi:rRNA pseudouridine synthase, partial [Candidatus Woesebacteria bacterium]|nr:rRNA pseudouridine synthase [Candidatus Woesebacteria bacterium]